MVVLVRPQNPSNLGSVARVAKNFGALGISIVEPGVSPDEDSRRLAVGADDLLADIGRYASLADAVADFSVVVATSSLRGRGSVRALSLDGLPAFLSSSGESARIAFVFGPESSGLTEDEIARCTAVLRLPTEPGFPTMNLSHSVALVLGVGRAFAADEPAERGHEDLAPSSEIEALMSHWDRALEAIDFYDTGHRDRSLRDWRRLIAARPLSTREVAILRGVANRILVSLERSSGRGAPGSSQEPPSEPRVSRADGED
jgi:TrmH family RNA methyltransferase